MKALLLISALVLAQPQASPSVAGKWLWQGPAGWQRIVLDLRVQGTRITGVVRMGPGRIEPKSPSDYWEFFLDPADFKILTGKIEGNTISFEHDATKALPNSMGLARGASGIRQETSRFVYRGTIQGNRIEMTREMVANKVDPWVVGNHKVGFVVERVP
jgi:hypothetical protein